MTLILFVDVSGLLPENFKFDTYPFPFRKEQLEKVIVNDKPQLPELLDELKLYLKDHPEQIEHYRAPALALISTTSDRLTSEGKLDEALKLLDYAQTLSPGREDLILKEGRIKQKAGRLDEALAAFKPYLDLSPDNSILDAWIGTAEILQAKGMALEAYNLMKQCLEMKPENEGFWTLFAELETAAGKSNRPSQPLIVVPVKTDPLEAPTSLVSKPVSEPLPPSVPPTAEGQALRPMLTFISGVDNGRKIPLHSPFTLGRSEDNDMFLADRKVSRNHAQLYQENGVWYVKDLNSSNGVYVNSTRIQEPVSLKENDDIIFGDTQAIFSFSEITPPAGAHISINFGAPSAAKCPHCGNEVKPDALFCGTCGKKISA